MKKSDSLAIVKMTASHVTFNCINYITLLFYLT